MANAIKFTPPGGRVDVTLSRSGPYVSISVSDTGSGINPEFLPHVFERFRQADASTTRRHGGLGLGLAIVRSLVEQHGGSVHAASEGEGRGATFTVRLPVRQQPNVQGPAPHFAGPADPQPADIASREFRATELTGLTILVVDDEPDARALLERLLGECGARVMAAGSAAEALRRLESATPDVLISDIGMPDVDGYELIRRVRGCATATSTVQAIALTAFARPEDRERAIAAGFDAHLSKPVEPSELVGTVAQLAGRSSTS